VDHETAAFLEEICKVGRSLLAGCVRTRSEGEDRSPGDRRLELGARVERNHRVRLMQKLSKRRRLGLVLWPEEECPFIGRDPPVPGVDGGVRPDEYTR